MPPLGREGTQGKLGREFFPHPPPKSIVHALDLGRLSKRPISITKPANVLSMIMTPKHGDAYDSKLCPYGQTCAHSHPAPLFISLSWCMPAAKA